MQVERSTLPNVHTPYLSHCRQLMKDGIDPSEPLEITRDGRIDFKISSISAGSKWTVQEDPTPRFAKYNAPSRLRASANVTA